MAYVQRLEFGDYSDYCITVFKIVNRTWLTYENKNNKPDLDSTWGGYLSIGLEVNNGKSMPTMASGGIKENCFFFATAPSRRSLRPHFDW